MSETWPVNLDRIFGGDYWKALYEPSPQRLLFDPQREHSEPGVAGLLRIYRERLRELVGSRLLPESATFGKPGQPPLFELLFFAGNPRGIGPAHRIASHLVRRLKQ